MFGYGNAPQTTYDTPRAHFHMLIGISGVANGVVTVYNYRIKAMKCCTEEEEDYILLIIQLIVPIE